MGLNKKILVSIVGPTAVGKTAFAIELARYFQTEIISADSRQFYRELEIGTAKPDADELSLVKHHFINSHSIDEYYSAGMYERDAIQKLEELFMDHEVVIAVGGSGLFLKVLWDGLDDVPKLEPEKRDALQAEFHEYGLEPLLIELQQKDPKYFHEADHRNHQRIIRALEVIRASGKPFSDFRKGFQTANRDFANIKIGLNMERSMLFERINKRMDLMIAQGLFEEAESMLPFESHNALQTVGYSEIFEYMRGAYDKEEAIRLLKRNSRRYAKRQLTWFRKDGEVNWYEPYQLEDVIRLIQEQLDA